LVTIVKSQNQYKFYFFVPNLVFFGSQEAV
jgi:hypothetical protein